MPVADVEPRQLRHLLLFAVGDPVEVLLHAGGELVVDIVPEIVLEQTDDGERGERRDQRRPLFAYVLAVLNG